MQALQSDPVIERHFIGHRSLEMRTQPVFLQRLEALQWRPGLALTRNHDLVEQVIFIVGQQIRGLLFQLESRHDRCEVIVDDTRRTTHLVIRLAIPQCQQNLAMIGDKHAQLRILPVSGGTGRIDALGRAALDQRQRDNMAPVSQLTEVFQAGLCGEVFLIFRNLHRQRHDQWNIEVGSHLGHQLVRTFRQWRNQLQLKARKLRSHAQKKSPNLLSQVGLL